MFNNICVHGTAFSLMNRMRGVPYKSNISSFPHLENPPSGFYSPPPLKVHSPLLNNNLRVITQKNFIFSCSHCTCTSLYTQVMLIWILINVRYLQNVVFSFEKDSNGHNHSSGFHHRINKSLLHNFSSIP